MSWILHEHIGWDPNTGSSRGNNFVIWQIFRNCQIKNQPMFYITLIVHTHNLKSLN